MFLKSMTVISNQDSLSLKAVFSAGLLPFFSCGFWYLSFDDELLGSTGYFVA